MVPVKTQTYENAYALRRPDMFTLEEGGIVMEANTATSGGTYRYHHCLPLVPCHAEE